MLHIFAVGEIQLDVFIVGRHPVSLGLDKFILKIFLYCLILGLCTRRKWALRPYFVMFYNVKDTLIFRK